MKVAIIPARGGSKRIPRKNIKLFHGKPMIVYSIEAAKASGCFEQVIVSTDDQEIADIAKRYGAEVPFMRPPKLADDFATTGQVIAQVIEQLNERGEQPEKVCCLYATAPFVLPEDIARGLKLLESEQADFAFSATSFPFPIQRAIRLDKSNRVEMFQPEHLLTRSQDLEEAYHDAGQFYWGTCEAFLEQRPFFSPASVAVILPRTRVQDIDTEGDWKRAEAMYLALQSS